jgi:hypothetical protein
MNPLTTNHGERLSLAESRANADNSLGSHRFGRRGRKEKETPCAENFHWRRHRLLHSWP